MQRIVHVICALLLMSASGAEAAGIGSMDHAFAAPSHLTPPMKRLLTEPRLPEWRATVGAIRQLDPGRQLAAVQARINQASPVMRAGDAPASPMTMLRHGGDCKGYALAKMAMLFDLGWGLEDMRLLVVWLPFHTETHAVLLVRHQGHYYVLDNLAEPVMVDRYAFDDFTAVVGPYRWPNRASTAVSALVREE